MKGPDVAQANRTHAGIHIDARRLMRPLHAIQQLWITLPILRSIDHPSPDRPARLGKVRSAEANAA
jgi:hypothetical protein